MIEHAATCRSGDTTLVAGEDAIEAVVAEPADDYFVFLVSDANLQGKQPINTFIMPFNTYKQPINT